MRFDSLIIMRNGESLFKVSLAGFQRTQFITNQTRITIAFGDEGQTPFDGGALSEENRLSCRGADPSVVG